MSLYRKRDMKPLGTNPIHAPVDQTTIADVGSRSRSGTLTEDMPVSPFLPPRRAVEIGNDQARYNQRFDLLEIYNVKDYGAVGDGRALDGPAIQAAINAAQAAFDGAGDAVNSYVKSAPAVYFPKGRYRIDTTLLVGRQIHLVGQGHNTSVIAQTDNQPVFAVTITYPLLYSAATFEHLGLCGSNDTDTGFTAQHGIVVFYDAAGLDATIDVRWCEIAGMGGHGLYFPDNANTPRVFGSLIQKCDLDAIHFSGDFATNARILHNVIRENRRGVVYDGAAAVVSGSTPYLYSGDIAFNLFERNYRGSGQVGSSTRPAVGVELNNTRNVTVHHNYFELQLNHVLIGVAGGQASAYNRIHNNFFTGVSATVGLFTGFSGPARKPCDIAIGSSACIGMVCRDNVHEQPNRSAAGCSVTDWSNGAWADTLPVFAVIDGQQHVIDEGWTSGAGVETADTPLFRKLSDLGMEAHGLTKGLGMPAGLVLSPLDGTLAANEFVELKGQLTPYSAVGKSSLQFVRRSDGGAFLRVSANDNTDTLRTCGTFFGQEQGFMPGTGGIRDPANSALQVLGSRRTGWAAASGTATRTTFDTATVTTAQLAQRVKALIDDLIAHGIIGA